MDCSHKTGFRTLKKRRFIRTNRRSWHFSIITGSVVACAWTAWINDNIPCDWLVEMLRNVHNDVSVDVYNWMNVRHHTRNVTIPNTVTRWTHDWWAMHHIATSLKTLVLSIKNDQHVHYRRCCASGSPLIRCRCPCSIARN